MEELGRHSRRSRVIWHPESIPPFSSLWIVVQRFLMLNQPTRAAFAQDFLADAMVGRKLPTSGYWLRQPLNDYQSATGNSPVRLTRFSRVLKESSTAFRGCHIGDFPQSTRPYFGDFAVCLSCLAEGFHSVLYSFEGLSLCPAHGTTMARSKNCNANTEDLITNALRNPFGICSQLQKILTLPNARTPTKQATRDRVLGEIANWLMDVDSRCWLGRHASREVESLPKFTRRLVYLKTNLGLANAVPNWSCGRANEQPAGTKTVVVRFGSMMVFNGDLVPLDDRRATQHQTSLNTVGTTILADFKALRRHLKRRSLGSHGRIWLARLAKNPCETDINALLSQGGEQARRAWLLQLWWRHVSEREFNPKNGLHIRSMRLAVDSEIPLWIGGSRGNKRPQVDDDIVRLWIVRWISACGLLGFWKSMCQAASEANLPDVQGLDKRLAKMLREPQWGLGIGHNGELTLCLDFPAAVDLHS